MKNRVAIAILNWKQPQLTVQTIESILKINHPDFSYHIFLLDNGSGDKSPQIFKNKFGKLSSITLFDSQTNLGFAQGNNYLIQKILDTQNYDYILLANNDILVDPDFLQHLLVQAQKHPQSSIVGPKIYFAPGYEFHKDRYTKKQLGKIIWSAGGQMDWANIIGSNIGVDQYDIGQYDKINTKIDFISGCCMLISVPVFQKIGFLDSNYFMYLEDVDFCVRAKKSNLHVVFVPSSVIWHLSSGSSQSGGNLHDYFITRNRLLFASGYAHPRTKFALFRQAFSYLIKGNHWKRQAVIDYFSKNLGKGSWQ